MKLLLILYPLHCHCDGRRFSDIESGSEAISLFFFLRDKMPLLSLWKASQLQRGQDCHARPSAATPAYCGLKRAKKETVNSSLHLYFFLVNRYNFPLKWKRRGLFQLFPKSLSVWKPISAIAMPFTAFQQGISSSFAYELPALPKSALPSISAS